jgi:hypothetical protein
VTAAPRYPYRPAKLGPDTSVEDGVAARKAAAEALAAREPDPEPDDPQGSLL